MCAWISRGLLHAPFCYRDCSRNSVKKHRRMKACLLVLLALGWTAGEVDTAKSHCATGDAGDVIEQISVCDEYKVRKILPSDSAGLCTFYNTALGEESRRTFHPLGPHADDARCDSIANGGTRTEERMDLVVTWAPGHAEKHTCAIAREQSGGIVGWAFLCDSLWSPLLGIAMADAHQGRGLGKKVMRLLIRMAAEQQMHELRLNVLPDNLRAKEMYFHLGFQVIEEGDEMISMRLDINDVRHSLFPSPQQQHVSALPDVNSDAMHGDYHPPTVIPIASLSLKMVPHAGAIGSRQGRIQLRGFILGLVQGFEYQVNVRVKFIRDSEHGVDNVQNDVIQENKTLFVFEGGSGKHVAIDLSSPDQTKDKMARLWVSVYDQHPGLTQEESLVTRIDLILPLTHVDDTVEVTGRNYQK